MQSRFTLSALAVLASGALAVDTTAQLQERLTVPTVRNATPPTSDGATAMAAAAAAGWNRYGAGCTGNGTGSTCESLNSPVGAPLVAQALPNEYAYGTDLSQTTTILGFRLYTQMAATTTATTTVYVNGALYLEDPARPGFASATSVAEGTMAVGQTAQFYDLYLDTPVTVTLTGSSTKVWISQYDTTAIRPADLTGGTSPAVPTLWRRPPGGGTAWAPTGIIKFPAWELICQRGNVRDPVLHYKDTPAIGQTVSVLLAHGLPSSFAVPSLGISNTNYLGIPLPFDLGLLGAPGCALNASLEATFPIMPVSASGTVNMPLPIPNNANFCGVSLFNQWIVVDGATAASFVTSNGGQLDIGI